MALATNVGPVHGVDAKGQMGLRKRCSRTTVLPFLAPLPPCLMGREASGGAHHEARELSKQGHTVKLMRPQFVRPDVKPQKNDAQDAEGSGAAGRRPPLRFVPMQSVDQQARQALQRLRDRQSQARPAFVPPRRGVLAALGFVLAQGGSQVRRALPAVLADADKARPWSERAWRSALAGAWRRLAQPSTETEQKMQRVFERDDASPRLAQIEGIGPRTAPAFVAAMGTAPTCPHGRPRAAWLGRVPRPHARGGTPTLLGISQHGASDLRQLLSQGARAVIWPVDKQKAPRSRGRQGVRERRGTHRA